jgi:L-amino acid N-acyltransferase YncA
MLDSDSRWRLVRKLRAKPPIEGPPVIRECAVEDLAAVRDIYNYFVRNSVIAFEEKPLDLAEWQDKFELLQKLELPFLVAASARGEVLGFAYLAPWRQKSGHRKTVENTIYLRPAATGKRLGGKLMAELIERGREAGVREIVAVIADRGAAASIRLHESFGFSNQGHLGKVAFKFGRWVGTVLMQKTL